MFKNVVFHGNLNNQTGYGIHASNFTRELNKLIPVDINGEDGDVHISLLDVVTASQTDIRYPYPSILYTVWESTEYPAAFLNKFKLYDYLWVPSEWQKACSIAQGIPEEQIFVVPEGVDPTLFHPFSEVKSPTFNFLHTGQWQPRKATTEICKAFISAFPNEEDVRFYLGADTNFPSDTYKDTRERMIAYEVNDPRIVPIPFSAHMLPEQLIATFKNAIHCYVSCSRSEGWGLTTPHAMACGIPTIVESFGGATEYSKYGIEVRTAKTVKPFGIYGNWDVPGQWGEPDFEHLRQCLRHVYENYPTCKKHAMTTAEIILSKFSWESAAKKAYSALEVIFSKVKTLYNRRDAIFFVDCWPDSQAKMDTLVETIDQIHGFGYLVLVSSHYPLPLSIIEKCDFYLYEKQDIMSGEDKPVYWRHNAKGEVEEKECGKEYQGVAALNCARNAIDFCKDRYDWIYQLCADMEVDLEDWLQKVNSSTKPMVFMAYEGKKDGFGGGLWAARSDLADKCFPRLSSWKEYADMFPDVRFVAERWLFNHVSSVVDIEESVQWIECDTQNRFDNVDRGVWDDDVFHVNFVDGPFLNIAGLSNREYDVTFSTSDNPNIYTLKQKVGVWSKPSIKYYKDWIIQAHLDGELKFEHRIDLTEKRVLISLGSKALGDTISWMPYVEEFRKKHNCHVICSCWWGHIFDYPEIEFVNPGTAVSDIYAAYAVGCFDGQLNLNVADWRRTPLQKVAADILGIEYSPVRAKLKYHKPDIQRKNPYICFSEFSTMRGKFWNRQGGWQNIINYLHGLGYACISVSVEQTALENVIKHNGQSIEQTIADIAGAEFYIGLNHGPIWLAYALGVPAIMITGMSEEFNDFPNPYRIVVDSGCRPCFNDVSIPIDRGFDWCHNANKYVCTKLITEEMVINTIGKLREDLCPIQLPGVME